MRFRNLTIKQQLLYTLRFLCEKSVYVPLKVGNWATDRLNKSYYIIK